MAIINENGEVVKDNDPMFLEDWIFTFGSGQEYEGFYARVRAFSYSEAREKMVQHFGDEWAFQYSLADWNQWVYEAGLVGFPVETEIIVID